MTHRPSASVSDEPPADVQEPAQASRSPLPFKALRRAEIERLISRLAQRENPEQPEWVEQSEQDPIPAAVAIVLCPGAQGEASFLITRRAPSLRSHGGQWALPGGRLDPGETRVEGALRELDEEVGLELGQQAVLGCLDAFPTRSGYSVTPVVLWCPEMPTLTLNPDEVASAHLIPLSSFDSAQVPILTSIAESERPVLALPLMGQRVHAPTAAMVYQLFELVVRGKLVRVAHYEQPVFAWR